MINVSNSFKEELNNDNRDYMCYVDIVLVNPGDVVESYLQDSSGEYILDSSGENINTFFDGVVFSLTNENLWSSALSIEESVSNQNSFDIGSVIINKATVVINNIYEDYTSYDFTGAKVTIRIGLQLSNGTIEVVNKGIFYVDSATYNGSLITLECLDSMSKFDKDYSESELIYPATLRQIVQDACSVCGVLYSASIFENDTFIVNERPSDESLTFRQMLNYVGQIACQQFSIDHNDRLIARWYDRDMMDDLYSSPSSVDDSEYHQISSINSQNINQDDVIITGVKVTEFSEDTENPGGSYLSGTTGYVIEIKDNKLIPIGKGSGVSTYLGQKLVGMRFRPMELTFQNDPTIEPTDIAEVIDFKGNHFYTFITSTNFTVGNTQTLSCGAESATRNSASRYSAATQAYTNSKKLVEKEKTERELAVEALNNALSNASGMYTTEERQSDGSVITYLHDKPTLEESQNVIMITAEAIGISNDGGETYPYGLFLTGDLIARLLYVVGINADYINSGAITVADNDGEITFFADTETGRVDIKAYSLTITGKTVEEIANEESETVLNDFAGSVYTPTITNLQNQIDGKIETWYYEHEPTLENEPASGWTTDAEKQKHIGDLFYRQSNGHSYRFMKTGEDEFEWTLIQDSDIQNALTTANNAQDTADSKRRVFYNKPIPPYDIGDLWVQGENPWTDTESDPLQDTTGASIFDTTGATIVTIYESAKALGDIMRCTTARVSGDYNSEDWEKASKYTDDTAVKELDESLNQQEVFDRLTNGGTAQGIYMENGQLYILFSYAKGGVLQLGGLENELGELSLLDDSKNKLVSLSNKGMVIYSADSAKQIGKIGANRYSDGREFISTEIFPETSGIEWNRIDRNGKARILFRYNSSEKKEEEKIDLYMPFSVSRNNWNSKRDFLPVITSNVGNLSIKERSDIARSGYISIFLNETGYTGQRRNLNWFVVKENSENYAGMGFLQIYPGFMRIEDLYDSDALLLGNDINMNRHQILNQSDERVKNNITEYNESAIEIINEIGIYEYDWIESGIHEDAGFIAQQLESIIPNAVKINKLGESYSVLPIKIIPYLVKSVQELSKEIELLKKEICELKGETYISKESKKDKWKPSDMSLEEKREFIKSLKRAERRE